MSIRDMILDELKDDAVILEGEEFDDGIVGVTVDGRVVYDYYLLADALCKADGMTQEEAIDYIDYNTIRAIPYMGENAPVIIKRLEII